MRENAYWEGGTTSVTGKPISYRNEGRMTEDSGGAGLMILKKKRRSVAKPRSPSGEERGISFEISGGDCARRDAGGDRIPRVGLRRSAGRS